MVLHANVLATFVLLAGCASKPEPRYQPQSVKPTQPEKPLKRVTNRPENTDGVVFIVEYHRISMEEARWDRSVNSFKKDLERLRKLGFRPVSLTSYLDNNMQLAPGTSPVIFTFDDSHESQFNILPDGRIDPSSAMGIWSAFHEKYADFPIVATFFVLPPTPWGQSDKVTEKLRMLKEWGSELGTHTVSHKSLAKLTDEQVKKEIGDSLDAISDWGFTYNTIALPFGISPKNKSLLRGFTRNGKTYALRAALLVGANPAPSPNSSRFDPHRLPRIQAIEGDFGISYWLDRVANGTVKPYVAP